MTIQRLENPTSMGIWALGGAEVGGVEGFNNLQESEAVLVRQATIDTQAKATSVVAANKAETLENVVDLAVLQAVIEGQLIEVDLSAATVGEGDATIDNNANFDPFAWIVDLLGTAFEGPPVAPPQALTEVTGSMAMLPVGGIGSKLMTWPQIFGRGSQRLAPYVGAATLGAFADYGLEQIMSVSGESLGVGNNAKFASFGVAPFVAVYLGRALLGLMGLEGYVELKETSRRTSVGRKLRGKKRMVVPE